jgi:hypothetical protein
VRAAWPIRRVVTTSLSKRARDVGRFCTLQRAAHGICDADDAMDGAEARRIPPTPCPRRAQGSETSKLQRSRHEPKLLKAGDSVEDCCIIGAAESSH